MPTLEETTVDGEISICLPRYLPEANPDYGEGVMKWLNMRTTTGHEPRPTSQRQGRAFYDFGCTWASRLSRCMDGIACSRVTTMVEMSLDIQALKAAALSKRAKSKKPHDQSDAKIMDFQAGCRRSCLEVPNDAKSSEPCSAPHIIHSKFQVMDYSQARIRGARCT